jgi:hypothetical protein
MRKNYFFVVMLLVGVAIYSCSKDGLVGPEGPDGKTGATGAVGASGKDGSVMYSGNGAPAATLGILGDYYLDKNTAQLYGPKIATGWGTPLTLMGATGATGSAGTNGTNGSTTLSGNGAPAASLGANGDYYLDKTNFLLYGPKTTGGWGIPMLLKGADGTQGPTGAAGKDGSIIYSGTGVPVNTIGVNGDYYLDKNTGNLYGPKTTGGWGSPLVLKGTNGTNGTNGANGTNGSTTLSGTGAPSIGLGNLGDYYLDKTNYQLYGPKDAVGWGIPVLLRGADGAQGPMGPAGAEGTVIYSGNTLPDPNVGKQGDFYIDLATTTMYGPKAAGNSTSSWGGGISLKGANGTNGSTILSGGAPPQNTQGNNGDFYIDLTNSVMYGPKTGGAWSFPGTSLKGADGGGSNIMAFETADAATFDWVSKFNFFDGRNFKLRMDRHVVSNDTTTVFNLPAMAASAAQSGGSVMVYVRLQTVDADKQWMPLSFTHNDMGSPQYYTFNVTNYANRSSAVRIFGSRNTTDPLLTFDKIRIVVTPATTVGIIGGVSAAPMPELMLKLNLKDKDFLQLN